MLGPSDRAQLVLSHAELSNCRLDGCVENCLCANYYCKQASAHQLMKQLHPKPKWRITNFGVVPLSFRFTVLGTAAGFLGLSRLLDMIRLVDRSSRLCTDHFRTRCRTQFSPFSQAHSQVVRTCRSFIRMLPGS